MTHPRDKQSSDSGNRSWYLFGIVFGLVGALFLGLGILSAISAQHLLADGRHTQGEVIGFSVSPDDGNLYRPIVRFADVDGQSIQFIGRGGENPPAYEVGEKIELVYPTGRPEKAEIKSFFGLWGFALIGGGAGLLVLMVCVFTGIYLLRSHRRIQRLNARGKTIKTEFVSVERFNDDDDTYYFVRSQWRAPGGGKPRVFDSPTLSFDPSDLIDPKQPIRVRINPQQPNDYQMDTRFLPTEATD